MPRPAVPAAYEGRTRRTALPLLLGALVLTASPAAAQSACPMELSIYRDGESAATLEFRPTEQGAAVTNRFRMVFEGGPVFDGVVMWSQEVARPSGMLMLGCPEGDVTGEEIAGCTYWEGVIYAVDAAGTAGLLPKEGTPAPKTLILADLARALYTRKERDGLSKLPADTFTLAGCQE